MAFLWSVWYNMELTTSQQARLLTLLNKLLGTHSASKVCTWRFEDTSSKKTVHKVWRAWLDVKLNCGSVKRFRNKNRDEKMKDQDIFDKPYLFYLDTVAFDHFQSADNSYVTTEVLQWHELGYAKFTEEIPTVINPTLTRISSKAWCLHHQLDPALTYMPLTKLEMRMFCYIAYMPVWVTRLLLSPTISLY